MTPETADHINLTAADWAVKADRGLTPAEAAELASWLDGDRRRTGAYMRMTAVMVGTEPHTDAAVVSTMRPRPVNPDRRRWLIGGGAVAASIATGGLYLALNAQGRYETRKGEKRVVALADGSTVTLNTATRLEVQFAENQRLIRLTSGEALFDVAHDSTRPFIVRAGGVDVRAVGTSFTVVSDGRRPVRVLVREGVVEVVRPRISSPQPVRLAANTRAVLDEGSVPPVIVKVEPTEVQRELAWREGRLVFAGESLSAAAAEFARYSDTRILVADPALAFWDCGPSLAASARRRPR